MEADPETNNGTKAESNELQSEFMVPSTNANVSKPISSKDGGQAAWTSAASCAENPAIQHQPTVSRLDSADASFCLHRSPSILLENGIIANMDRGKHPRKGVGRWALPAGSPLRTTSSIPSLSTNSSGGSGFWAEILAVNDTSDNRSRVPPSGMHESLQPMSAVASHDERDRVSYLLMNDRVKELEAQNMILQVKLSKAEEKLKAEEKENSDLRKHVLDLGNRVKSLELQKYIAEKRGEIIMKHAKSLILSSAETTLQMSRHFFPSTRNQNDKNIDFPQVNRNRSSSPPN